MESFLSVEKDGNIETVIERSRFITHVFYVETEAAARENLEKLRKKYSDATHNCYAYITDFGLTTKSSDDGEPSGTAGVPILEVLKNKKLVNVLVVVTRYFGGIKLGAGGLVRAYSGACRDGVSACGIKEFSVCDLYNVTVKYEELNIFKRDILPLCYKVLNIEYLNEVKLTVAVKKSGYKSFIDKFKLIFYDKEAVKVGEDYY